MVVGHDVVLDDVPSFYEKTSVGRFCRKNMRVPALGKWALNNWKAMLSYTLVFHILPKGWICFRFELDRDASEILRQNWQWSPSGLVLQMWEVGFDSLRESLCAN
jgi:hypothetical protein